MEWVALQAGHVPLPVLDIILGPLQARALAAAVSMGVFDALEGGGADTAALALVCRCDAECLGLLLRVVRAMGYVALDDGQWTLTARGRRHFGQAAPEPYRDFVAYGPPQWAFMEHLETTLRTGAGLDFHGRQTEGEWELYERAMVENARSFADFVVEHLPVPEGATSCLDVGGGHGLVGAALAKRYPGLRSTVLERPEALPAARAQSERLGLTDRVTHRSGDLRTDDLGTDLDVVLLCNVLHHFSADANQDLLRRASRALRPGGCVGIFDLEVADLDAPADAAGDAFALFFRITSTSACFRGVDYEAWMQGAGLSDIRAYRTIRLRSRVLAAGVKLAPRPA